MATRPLHAGASLTPTDRGIAVRAKSAPGTGGLSGWGLAILLLGFSLSVIDFFIVNVALPTMSRDLHASDSSLQLIVAGYGLSYALLLVLGGRLGDASGRRRLFVAGMAAFTVTSLCCGIAPSVLALICARVLQGVAAALMVPQVLATIHASLQGPRRARAVGMYGATAGLSIVVGQALGGLIVSADIAGSGWRGIFLVNVPIGLFALFAVRRSLPETRSESPAAIDLRGTVLLAGTLLCLLLPLTEGRALGWPWWSWVALALVPFGALAFVRRELALEAEGRMALVPPSIVRVTGVRRGLAVVVAFFGSFGGFTFVYAIVSQTGFHVIPLLAGLALVPFAMAFFVTSLFNARLIVRLSNKVLAAGGALDAVALLGLAATLLAGPRHAGLLLFLPSLILMGVAQGLLVAPLFRLVLSEVPDHLAGAGAGVLTTCQQLAIALGVALIGALYAGLAPSMGYAHASALIAGLEALVGLGIWLGARWLPELA